MRYKYSEAMKESVVKKVLNKEKRAYEVSKETGIARSTLSVWLKNYKQGDKMNANNDVKNEDKRPKDWSGAERIDALIKTGGLGAEEKAWWCRQNGIFEHHLKQWEKDAIEGVISKDSGNISKEMSREIKDLKKEIESLTKDINRKDRALAETTALLVLKKKADYIWGESKGA